MILLYEVHDIRRFADEVRFLSYGRLVGGVRESAGKSKGTAGRKIGNARCRHCEELEEPRRDRATCVRKNEPIAERIDKHHVQTTPGLFCDSRILFSDPRWILFGDQLLYIFLYFVRMELDCRTRGCVTAVFR